MRGETLFVSSNIRHSEESTAVALPEAPVDGDVIVQQDIRQASFGAVLCDDADVRDLH